MYAETTIRTSEGMFTGVAENISLGGLFVRMSNKVGVGDKTDISISVPGASSTDSIVAKGVAVRVEASGMAFKFYNIDHKTFCDLLSLMDGPRS
jgi:hypothetical protein